MKVAVMSSSESIGKTYLIATLAGVYSRSQKKRVAILSTGSTVDNSNVVDIKVKDEAIENAQVFRAVLNSSQKGDTVLLNYGLKQGNEEVYIYNVMDVTMEDELKKEFFINCLEKLPVDLVLVELAGKYDTDWNRSIMGKCDCYFYMFGMSQKGLKQAADYKADEKQYVVGKTAFVMSRYDPAVVGEKKIHKTTNIPQSSMFQWPYSVQLAKMGFDGMLDSASDGIIRGQGNLIPLREKMQEMMQFIFDSPSRRVIREVSKWYK